MLQGCLGALAASVGPGDDVIVVDSCSTGSETAEVASAYGVELIRAERPGASLARNLGWRASRHPVVAFVDDDVRVFPGWADALRAAFGAHPEATFVTGRLRLRPEDAHVPRPVAHFDVADPFEIGPRVTSDFGHGANLAVRRGALERVGGYDELMGPGARWRAAEDLDLLDRLVEEGYTGRYDPGAEAVHVQWRARKDLLRLEWSYGVGQGARLDRLRRVDRDRFRAVARLTWLDLGLVALGKSLRSGYEFGALSALVHLAGVVVGGTGRWWSTIRSRNLKAPPSRR
jgi:GT2 family glycosyltransferase